MDTWTSKVLSSRPIRHSVVPRPPHLNPGAFDPMQTETSRRRWIASEDAQQLWRDYNRTRDTALRDRLIMTYAPLVKYIAYRKVRELPASCQVEDFISCGLEALINAIDRYDPEKGATLEQFAWTRIHGAILDELRRQDWAPRSVRRWAAPRGRGPPPRPPGGPRLRDCPPQLRRRPRPPAHARGAGRLARHDAGRAARPRAEDRHVGPHVAQRDRARRGGLERRARRHSVRRRHLDEPGARRLAGRREGPLPQRLRPPPPPSARDRDPALRQGAHAPRDRRGPRRLRKPRLPDPHRAQALAAHLPLRGRGALPRGRLATRVPTGPSTPSRRAGRPTRAPRPPRRTARAGWSARRRAARAPRPVPGPGGPGPRPPRPRPGSCARSRRGRWPPPQGPPSPRRSATPWPASVPAGPQA